MSKTRGTGLLMVWTDIDHEFEAEFNRWYDEEHISQLLRVPGFLSAGRYAALKGGPKYLAMYELEDHNVLQTAAFRDTLRYQPSPLRARDCWDGSVSPDGADRCLRRDRRGIQRLVQYCLYPRVSRSARMPRRSPVCRCRGPAQISHRLRV